LSETLSTTATGYVNVNAFSGSSCATSSAVQSFGLQLNTCNPGNGGYIIVAAQFTASRRLGDKNLLAAAKTTAPTKKPTSMPVFNPTFMPSAKPVASPSKKPSMTPTGTPVKASPTASPVASSSGSYAVTATSYSDSACTQSATVQFTATLEASCATTPFGIYGIVTTSTTVPTSFDSATAGVNYIIYSTSSKCTSNAMSSGVYSWYWAPMNTCYSANKATGGYDLKYTSCSGSTLKYTLYTTSNGSCGGTGTATTVTAGSQCSAEETWQTFEGYPNFYCTA